MQEDLVAKFKEYFYNLPNSSNSNLLEEIYAPNIKFQDPIHSIHGIENLKLYFQNLNKNLEKGSFKFTEETILENKAFLCWDMSLELKKPKKQVFTTGITLLTFEKQIIKPRDYFDAGELFYENIPILGSFLKSIKKKIATM